MNPSTSTSGYLTRLTSQRTSLQGKPPRASFGRSYEASLCNAKRKYTGHHCDRKSKPGSCHGKTKDWDMIVELPWGPVWKPAWDPWSCCGAWAEAKTWSSSLVLSPGIIPWLAMTCASTICLWTNCWFKSSIYDQPCFVQPFDQASNQLGGTLLATKNLLHLFPWARYGSPPVHGLARSRCPCERTSPWRWRKALHCTRLPQWKPLSSAMMFVKW